MALFVVGVACLVAGELSGHKRENRFESGLPAIDGATVVLVCIAVVL